MASGRTEEVRDYAFADKVLALRKRTGLTQKELADRLGVTTQSIHNWEGGLSYPGSDRLKQIIAFYLEHGALEPGQEREEAEALWETARERAPRRVEPFDPAWFPQLASAAEPLPSEAPRRHPERPPSNLPLARTSFIGRIDDVRTLTESLTGDSADAARLLSLTGIAGSGKTRLALTVGEAVLDAYPDGVWLVELAPLPTSRDADPAPIAAAALLALRVRDMPGWTSLDSLIEDLQSRRLLLVLDNCEHVVEAAASLATQVLAACPEVRILATSQYPLGVPPERASQVDVLDLPAAIDGMPTQAELDQVRRCEAVELFVERAHAVRPDFALSIENAASVVAICRQLDGLPLAIELAAARLNMLPVDELLHRLTSGFTVLRRGGRLVVDRHQTLEATLDWSYRLLEQRDRAVLRRLAVFAGGWELSAAEAVCADEGVLPEAVLEALDELLARSLIYVSVTDGAPRFGMLETVRQYGLQQLHLTGEANAVRDRHAAWCLSLTEQTAVGLHGTDQVSWFTRLDREIDNLRAALQWAVDRQMGELGLRVATGLRIYWRSRATQTEGRRWFAALLALAEPGEMDSMVRADALEGAAWLAEDQHDFVEASALFVASSAIRQALGQDDNASALLINRALEARAVGDYRRATALLEESLARHRAQDNRESLMHGGLGISLSRLALVLNEQGDYARAQVLQEECLAFHRKLGDQEGIAWGLLGLGDIARNRGDGALTREYSEQTLALFQDLGHGPCIGFSLNNLALAALMEGNLDEAAGYAEEGERHFRSLRHPAGLAEMLVSLGRIRGAQGETHAAQAALSEALDLAQEQATRFVVAAALDALAIEAIRQGDARRGVSMLSAVETLRETMGVPVRPADRAERDQALDGARTCLGAESFAAAWRSGQGLTLERVADSYRRAS